MLPSWISQTVAAAAVFGPISHYALWIRIELDGLFYRFVPFIVLLQPLPILLFHRAGLSVFTSYLLSVTLQATYLTTLFTSVSIYRLFFHSTRVYPGPFWARLWAWWKIKAFLDHDDKGYTVIDELHRKYGDVVRIGPRQISINHVDAIAAIYGSASSCSRGAHSELGKQSDLQSLRDKAYHKHRRQMWDQGLNPRACQQYLPRMNRTTNLFIEKLSAYKGRPVLINDWMHFFTFDLMGDLGFGRSYGQLESGKLHPAISDIYALLKYSVLAIQVTWLANISQIFPHVEDPMKKFMKFSDMWLADREKREPKELDIMSFILKAKTSDSKFDVPRSAIVDDSVTMQIAASDTSYSTFIYILYYLAKSPEVQTKLRAEVSPNLEPNSTTVPDWPKLQAGPFLDSLITETLRMHPPVPQGLTRETPYYTGAQIGPYSVPRETMLSVPTWTIQHDERYFARPHEWIPERWTTQPELVKDRRAWIPFSTGPTVCAGKYLAMLEMKLFLAKVIMAFDVKFAPGEDGKGLIDGHKDFFTIWLPDTMMCMMPRGETKKKKGV